jgi:DNA-binding response OmpR family regulator
VLVVEDDPAMAALVRHLIAAAGYQQITTVASGAEALAAAADAELVILDHELPDTTGIALLPHLVARADPPSVVVVTGAGSETLAAAALRAGADDYVAKDAQLRELLPQVLERVRRHRALRTAQDAVEQELVRAERLAAIGEMTVTLHHEINNPLMAATTEMALLAADPGLTPAQAESVATVRGALERIGEIVRQAGRLREAASHDYLAGLRMIYLASDVAPAMPHRGRALLAVADEDVARLVSLVLRHSGFSVERVDGPAEAARAAARAGVSLVVLSAVGRAGPDGALGDFPLEPGRPWGLAVLVAGNPEGARAAGADRVISLPLDPATLAEELLAAAESRHG